MKNVFTVFISESFISQKVLATEKVTAISNAAVYIATQRKSIWDSCFFQYACSKPSYKRTDSMRCRKSLIDHISLKSRYDAISTFAIGWHFLC